MNEQNEIVLYQTEDGKVKLDVQMHDESMWLTQEQMAELFQRDKSVISRHIKNIFEEGELNEKSTVAFFATVQQEGNRQIERQIQYYNLDVIISVGYRVHSIQGTRFRQWANGILKDYVLRGYAANQRLLAA